MKCHICKGSFKLDEEVIRWELGNLTPCQKRHGYYFETCEFFTGEEAYFFHKKCLEELMCVGYSSMTDIEYCAECGGDLRDEEYIVEWSEYSVRVSDRKLILIAKKINNLVYKRASICLDCLCGEIFDSPEDFHAFLED